ncbi:hypothetical protein BJY01DRAFT_225445 [Aspergillus pseudoustus]|uniref:Zn(2)-C6 fungal-type domain-containing protein n=1 Tax=Aspergillus pseudoustus TaxID=1810923 RepID=A0ABR4J211_9EURO
MPWLLIKTSDQPFHPAFVFYLPGIMNQTAWIHKLTASKPGTDMATPTQPDLGSFPMPEMADMPAPIPSPVAAAPPRPVEDLPLRNSCGSCNQAKVRCSKDRPTCRRCASRNTTCVYGVSLRGMKRPRADAQLADVRQPEKKKRATSLPSPVLSEAVPTNTVNVPGQTPFFPDWNSDIYTGSFVNDGLSALLPLNTFDTSLVDQPPFPFSLGDVGSPSPPFQPFVSSHMALPPMSIPLSPISPPASRDSHFGTLATAACPTAPGSCCCQQTIGYKLAELKAPKQQGVFVMDEFLKEHRANMALCTAVLECSAEQHKAGMMLLVEIIALLFHMVAAFDQILQQKDKTQVPTTCPPRTPSDQRKEQVAQANILRAELAKLGALIQDFDRRHCTLDNNTSWGEDTFLLSPLFVNLQWKTQSRFDAVRSWIPWL